MEANKKRHPVRNTILIGVLGILAIVIGIIWWQRDNLESFRQGMQYTQEELEEQSRHNQEAIEDAMAQLPEIAVRPLTEDEKQAIHHGMHDTDALADQLVQEPAKNPKPVKQPEGKPEELLPVEPLDTAYEEKLNRTLARFYILREEYLGKLERLEAEAKAEYRAMPTSERTHKALIDLGTKYIAKATRLEDECDENVLGIAAELEDLLRENQKDLSLVDTVIGTYAEEKRLKKAWYLSRIKEKGLM